VTGNELADKILASPSGMKCADTMIENLPQIVAALRAQPTEGDARDRLKAAFDSCPDPYVHNYLKAFGDKYLSVVSPQKEIK